VILHIFSGETGKRRILGRTKLLEKLSPEREWEVFYPLENEE